MLGLVSCRFCLKYFDYTRGSQRKRAGCVEEGMAECDEVRGVRTWHYTGTDYAHRGWHHVARRWASGDLALPFLGINYDLIS